MKILRTTLWASVGLFGLAAVLAAPASADQQILDDLIVDGSACIGQDCVNGESFGFDTLRLKENNLRIKAQDTSNSASFPTQDWELTFNESSNGGLNKFSVACTDPGGKIPFTIEACAPTHSLYVEADGDIGINTNNPVVELHIVDGDTPTLRLEQNGSSGFTPQTWDLAGNETNFFIRDVTNGSKLPFRIRPGANESSIDIQADSEVGIGTSNAGAKLHVLESGSPFSAFDETGLLVQNNAATNDAAILTLISGSASNAQINFGESGDEFAGRLLYTHATDEFEMRGGNFEWDLGGTDGFMRLTSAGLVTMTPTGACNPGPCDGVFAPDYEVESIEDHAAYMWENQHLWAVGPTREGEPMNLNTKTTGILHELEKAHIYIEQLHQRLAEVEEALAVQADQQ